MSAYGYEPLEVDVTANSRTVHCEMLSMSKPTICAYVRAKGAEKGAV